MSVTTEIRYDSTKNVFRVYIVPQPQDFGKGPYRTKTKHCTLNAALKEARHIGSVISIQGPTP